MLPAGFIKFSVGICALKTFPVFFGLRGQLLNTGEGSFYQLLKCQSVCFNIIKAERKLTFNYMVRGLIFTKYFIKCCGKTKLLWKARI